MGELNLRNAIILGTPSQQVQRVCNRILHVRGKKRKRRNDKHRNVGSVQIGKQHFLYIQYILYLNYYLKPSYLQTQPI